MKGSLEGVLPMIGLLIMALVLATQSIPLSEAMSQIVGESTSDIERVVNTRSYADFYFYNYVPLAADYIVNDVSYELGQNAGGENWDSSWLGDYDSNMRDLRQNLNEYSSSNLSEEITGSEGRCSIPDSDYRILVFIGKTESDFQDLDDEEITMSVGHDISSGSRFGSISPEPIETTCSFEGQESFYQDESLFYSTSTNATDNRYIQLADESLNFFLDLKESLNTVGNESDTHSSCGSYPSYSGVEEDAAENLEEEVNNEIDDVKSNYPTRDGFEIKEADTVIDADYKYGFESDVVDASSSSDRWTGSCCGGCGDPNETNEYYHYSEVEVSPTETEVDWVLEDTKYKVIVEQAYENLQFRIEPYEHNW